MFRSTFLLLLVALLNAAAPAIAKDGEGGSGGGDDKGGHGSDDGKDDNGGDSGNGGDSDDDGSSARAGVSSGVILPLAAILAEVEPEFGARMIDADIKNRRGRMVYEIELITRNGRVLDLEVDAATARVLGIEVDD
jgi:uncharacterized membrane protein YkoI